MKRIATFIKYSLFFFFAVLFFMFVQNVRAHDNASGTCIHVPNQWVSCGSENRCEGPDLVNDWVTCYVDAGGNESDCSTIANDLHQANAPQCAPKVCPDVGWGSSPGSYCGAQCVSCGVTSDRYYDSNCNCVTTGTFSDPSYCTNLCPVTETPTSSPTPSIPPPTATLTSIPPTLGSSSTPTKTPTSIPGASATPTKAPTPIPGASATPTRIPTMTPTRIPACNVNCVRDSDCQGARDLCVDCVNNRCQVPPTPTPVPACNVRCVRDSDCQGARDLCTACINNTCQKPATPTPTPIPFNAAACKCDGIDYTNIFSGQPVAITSYGKVEGADISKAKIVDQKFFFAEGAETIATIIEKSNPIPATIISSTPTKVRYASAWTFTMPQLKQGATYRIWSQINCQPKTSAYNYSSARNVLGTSDTSFFGGILNFFGRLFFPTPTPVTLKIQESQPIELNISPNQLQLGTFLPASVHQKTCSFIKFRASIQ